MVLVARTALPTVQPWLENGPFTTPEGACLSFGPALHCIKAGFHFHRDHIGLASNRSLNASGWLQRSKQNWSKFTSQHVLAQGNFNGWTRIRLSGNDHSRSALLYARLAFDQKAR